MTFNKFGKKNTKAKEYGKTKFSCLCAPCAPQIDVS